MGVFLWVRFPCICHAAAVTAARQVTERSASPHAAFAGTPLASQTRAGSAHGAGSVSTVSSPVDQSYSLQKSTNSYQIWPKSRFGLLILRGPIRVRQSRDLRFTVWDLELRIQVEASDPIFPSQSHAASAKTTTGRFGGRGSGLCFTVWGPGVTGSD